MKQFLTTVAGVFVGLLLFFVGLPFLLIVFAAASAQPSTPARTVLTLDLRQSLTDQAQQGPLQSLGGRMSALGVAAALRRAETDDKVRAVLVRLPESGISPATADELRLAFLHFRQVGRKPIYAHSQGVYAGGATLSTYMLGAAADQFWMQPGAALQSTGLATEDVFLKRAFDKYGLQADYLQRYEYKNAANTYLYSDYTAPHKEATLSWISSVTQSAVARAAADRRQQPAALAATLAAGPYDAEAARARGLIDRVGQVREAEQALLKAAGDGAKLVEIADYRPGRTDGDGAASGDAIAVIGAEGAIVTGTATGANPFVNDTNVYSDDVAKAFRQAIDDRSVKAIVFRVSSPGGSDTASEQILAAVREAKAAGKPVVVSMGPYAASGGYWISSQASAIVAQPTTITGSIGVFGGKFVLGPALARFGVDVRQTEVGGDFASAFSTAQPFTPEQRTKVNAWMDGIYQGFLTRVAEGRRLPVARVAEIAKGRVWTGEQARALGLVDEVGGFYQAVDRAKALSGLKDRTVELKTMQTKPSPIEAFSRALGVTEAAVRGAGVLAGLTGDPATRAVLNAVADARLRSDQRVTVLADTPRL